MIFTLIRLVCLNPSDSSVQINQMEYIYVCMYMCINIYIYILGVGID